MLFLFFVFTETCSDTGEAEGGVQLSTHCFSPVFVRQAEGKHVWEQPFRLGKDSYSTDTYGRLANSGQGNIL